MAKAEEKKENETIEKVKALVSPQLEDIDVLTGKGFMQDLLLRVQRVDISALGAQLAYFFLLSFFPLIIFLVTLLPFLNLQVEQIYSFLATIMPIEIYTMIEGTLKDVLTNRNGGLLSIGILGTVWSASKGINALMNALNKAYETESKSGMKDRALSLVFTLALVIVVLLALVLPIFGQQIISFMTSFIDIEMSFVNLFGVISWVMPPLLIFIVLIGLYWVVPNTNPRLKLRSVWLGAVFATAAWMILTYGFSFYVDNFGNFSATYGSIGGVIMLMLWLYFTGMILIFGGILNATMQKRTLAKQVRKAEV
ncbi:hypothetical protein BN1050_01540 [Metalysinibacillus saudimassiliensis]|uniref:Uncharacterized protein n=1 Tax=Metalysinibacillus saudimassiliensis TaxID=1461583 RepID=A0A078MAN1_9BACL|nr:hypothetical protein BN1050_01540 [Metalysinibacillus saudimassiliensis]